MPLYIIYLLKGSISLAIVWLFYQLLLRRLTFYNWNRWYLLGYSLLSFLIPLINIGPMVEKGTGEEPTVFRYVPVIGNYVYVAAGPTLPGHAAAIDPWLIVRGVLILGMMALLARMAVRWHSLRRIRRGAQLIEGPGVNIYQVAEPITPFSFGSAIYINGHRHSEKEWEAIILHEYVHIRQRHTIDVLLAELLCIVNWYNPFAWLVRHAIRQNLEFIADEEVLQKGFNRKGYQYHLLKVVGAPVYRLANNFNFTSLKKRIVMMNKIKSTRLHLVRFLFLFPLLAVLLVAFRDKYGQMISRKSDPVVTTTAPASKGMTIGPSSGGHTDTVRPVTAQKKLIMDTEHDGRVTMQADTILWSIGQKPHRDFVYFINGVRASQVTSVASLFGHQDVRVIEVAENEAVLKKYGIDPGKSLLNAITGSNEDNPAAHMLDYKGPDAKMLIDQLRTNMLYYGVENPVKIDVADASPKDVVVKVGEGGMDVKIEERNGIFYIKPEKTGNIEIRIFKKGGDGRLQYLNSRFFRVVERG